MKQYLQHSITYQIELRSPKQELLLCSDDTRFIYKKEKDDEHIR